MGMLNEELQYCEFFAGAAECFRAVQNARINSCAVDIKYMQPEDYKQWNSFDLLSPAGLALGIWLLLQCRENAFFVVYAVTCSSWVTINRGTSQRSLLCPEGFAEGLNYIKQANALTSRKLALA
ncbi:unnamed protein product [Effrenium voratum]|nr:unnamed protein product [Effrenium voratum]